MQRKLISTCRQQRKKRVQIFILPCHYSNRIFISTATIKLYRSQLSFNFAGFRWWTRMNNFISTWKFSEWKWERNNSNSTRESSIITLDCWRKIDRSEINSFLHLQMELFLEYCSHTKLCSALSFSLCFKQMNFLSHFRECQARDW